MFDVVVILGPTASGKSALSLELARRYNCEIISLDSALVYKGMDIGTAKPSKEEMAICPHHLIDICDPAESYSAADFRKDCIRLVEEIRARSRLPVICGGTMMYYKALVDGLSPLPESNPSVRAMVEAMANEQGWATIHSNLKSIDPEMHSKIAPNDKQRISRVMEIYILTGKSMSSFLDAQKEQCPFSRFEVVLLPEDNDRTRLREMIRKRLELMFEQGFIDEVKKLAKRNDLTDDMPSMRSVGYRQVLKYLRGEVSLNEAFELSVIATSRLAKHQMTWLRGGLKESHLDDKACRFRIEIEDQNKAQHFIELIDAEPSFSQYRKL